MWRRRGRGRRRRGVSSAVLGESARTAFERAMAILGKTEIDPLVVAEAKLGLARASREGDTEVSPEMSKAREEILRSPYASAELKRWARSP